MIHTLREEMMLLSYNKLDAKNVNKMKLKDQKIPIWYMK